MIGSFVGSAFALVRMALAQNRAMMEGFVRYLEGSLRHQEEVNSRLTEAVDSLRDNVRENMILLSRIAERLNMTPEDRHEPER